ncbi:hypothetical protein WR25_23219 [Diploscapter pachys]|uniref:Uncharacterized protein n=1 Tax=Diploscapter pachys TaxID=2018661 RepID=A0A2A2JJS4_9BILA|nr:hypothetical protein WR25_23219 [Diploscapter pachys]
MDYRDPARRSPPIDSRRVDPGRGDFRGDILRPPPADWSRDRDFTPQIQMRNGGDRIRGSRHDPEFIPSDHSPVDFGRKPLENKLRSKSLDLRDAFPDEYESPRGFGRRERIYDYERDDWNNRFGTTRPKDDFYSKERPVDIGRPREIEIPLKRIPRAVARSQELVPYNRDSHFDTFRHPRHSPRDDFLRGDPRDLDNVKYSRETRATLNRSAGYSPKSIASSRPPPDFIGSNRYSTHRADASRDRDYYREEARGSAAVGGGDISRGGHFKSSRHHNSHHHESHGSGGHSGGGFFGIPRKVINQQPGAGGATGSRSYHQEWYSSGGGGMRGGPPHHRQVQCCCFKFIWPPWSVEPTHPPQQIYKNI